MATRFFAEVQKSHGHRTGKAFYRKNAAGAMMILDGQQRTTTMLLCVAALRDRALDLRLTAVAQKMDACLYCDPARVHAWVAARCRHECSPRRKNEKMDEREGESADSKSIAHSWCSVLAEGEDLREAGGASLLPSYLDRKAFAEALTVGLFAKAYGVPRQSLQLTAGFQAEVKLAVDAAAAELGEEEVCAACHSVTHCTVMFIEIHNEVNLAQSFLWLQESSLFSMGALLHNPTPGVSFSIEDLARNLLLSPVLELPLDEQLSLHHRYWTIGIERACGGRARVVVGVDSRSETALGNLIKSIADSYKGSHKSLFEQRVAALRRQLPSHLGAKAAPAAPMGIYSRFVSWVESLHGCESECMCNGEEVELRWETCVTALQYMADRANA